MQITGVAAIDKSTAPYIVGSDEVGYGCYAGPLVVCATIVSRDWPNAHRVTDSKALTPAKRTAIAKALLPGAVYAMVSVPPADIDAKGVYESLIQAHIKAITDVQQKHIALGCVGEVLIVADGSLPLAQRLPGVISLPRADTLIPAVSFASILAKVARDAHMVKMGEKYKGFGFEKHMGYGTPEHEAALKRLGPCEIHRKSYGPVAKAAKLHGEDPPVDMNELFAELEDRK